MFVLSVLAIEYGREVFVYFRAQRVLDAAAVMGIGMMIFVAVLYGWYLPGAEYLRVSPRVADALKRQGATSAGDVIMIDYKEPSLAFYQGATIREQRQNDYLQKTDDTLRPRWLVITDRIWQKTPEPIRGRWIEVDRIRGWAYADGGNTVQVLVLRRKSALD